MIHVDKHPKPQILVDNEAPWTAEYLDALAAGGAIPDAIRYRYRHADVKAALRAEAFGKCVYCEARIPVGETDHFRPVVGFPAEIVMWVNLLLACKECNTNKGSYYSDQEPLINPSIDDPLDDIFFFGPMAHPRNGSAKGLRTIQRLRLERIELFQARAERIRKLRPLIQEWRLQQEGPTKELLKATILEEAGADREYSALVRTYLFQECGW